MAAIYSIWPTGCLLTLDSPSASRIAVSYLTVIQLASSSSTLAATPRELPTISINGLRTVSPTDVEGAALALANAIYFKGIRKCPFDPDRTAFAPFRVSSSESTQVNMMTQAARFRYSLNRRLNCQIIELPYRGNRLAMYILLPKKVDGLASLEGRLTFSSVTSALARLRTRRISVAIPRFEMTVGKELPEVLKTMGMNLAFTPAADFTGMSRNRALYIAEVIHKAFIGVDEEGTDAAAATVVVTYGSTPSSQKKFVADHPFVFLIRDKITGMILFFGRLAIPSR